MPTLERPAFVLPELFGPNCEQVITGDSDLESEEEEEGKLGSGDTGVPPEPLQGEPDQAEEAWESDADEGGGT